jgi:starvation-inducible outer membrane lipoprotein
MRKTLFLSALMGAAVLMLSSCATTEKSLQERKLSPLTHSELEALYSRAWTTH